MNWRIKGVVQQVLGRVPGGERAHYVLQRKVGGLRNFARECDIKVDDFRIMIGHLQADGVDLGHARLLEIGTGWYPTFPFCLHLMGAPAVATFDLNRHLKPDLVVALAERLEQHLPLLATLGQVDEAVVREGQIVRPVAAGNAVVAQAAAAATAAGAASAAR